MPKSNYDETSIPLEVNIDKDWSKPLVQNEGQGRAHVFRQEVARTVFFAAKQGIPSGAICQITGLSWPTVLKYYKEPLHGGRAEAERIISGSIRKIADNEGGAIKDETQLKACQYILGTQHGWKQTTVNELVGKDGDPIKSEIDVTKLSTSALKELTALSEELDEDD